MMQEYARVCLAAINVQYPRPPMPHSLLEFLIKGGDDPELLYIHGTVYANGIGVPVNGEKAHKLLTRAAVFGHAHAMYTISGESQKKLAIAAKGGSSRACFELGILLGETAWVECAIELSPFPFDSQMRFSLASCYADAGQTDDALPLFYMLARMNHIPSILRLARIFFDMAETNSKYLIKSMHWAMQVDTPAALKIRGMISLKLGFSEKAFEYMLTASKSSDPAGIDATYELARFYELGCGTPLNDVLAMEMLEKGAAAGHSSAQFDLAIRQFETDRPRAFRLLREASKTHAVAMHMLARLEEPDAELLLANAGKLIPSALFDLAVRKMDDDMFYEADALLKEAIKMPEPTFDCGMLNVERVHELIAEIEHKIKSMDNIIRLVQFGNYNAF